MRMRFLEPAPVDANVYCDGNLKMVLTDGDTKRGYRWYAKAWRGRSQKPYAYFEFQSVQRRNEWVERQIAAVNEMQADKIRRREERKQAVKAMRDQMEVGTILHYSWGYDQTQCEFFQVVECKSASVVIRRIGSRVAPGSEYCNGDRLIPRPGHFIGDAFVKRIMQYGVSMECGTASPCDPKASYHHSWGC